MFNATELQIRYIESTSTDDGPATPSSAPAPAAPSGERTVLCSDARQRRAQAAARFHDFDRLVYLVSAASAVAIVITIVMVVFGQSGSAVATAVGGIVGGGAAVFLVARRREAQAEEAEAWKEVEEHCAGQVIDLERSARVAQRFE